MQFRMAQTPLDRFDWSLVRSFLAVLDAGSLLGAARRLGAQQPTLSRQVAQLDYSPGNNGIGTIRRTVHRRSCICRR